MSQKLKKVSIDMIEFSISTEETYEFILIWKAKRIGLEKPIKKQSS